MEWLFGWGYHIENKTLKKTVEARHQLRHPPAWAIQSIVIETLRAEQLCDAIEINDTTRGVIFRVTFENFLAQCELLDRRHGRQYFLRLRYWERLQTRASDAKQFKLF